MSKLADQIPLNTYLDRFSFSILQFCQKNELIKSGDKVLVSVSGGIDSTCLFRILHSIKVKIDYQLHVVHFNHGIREESEEEESFVKQLAMNFDTKTTVIKSNKFNNESGMQAKARDWRNKHLNEIMQSLGYNKIALGHHLDDLVETQIWRLTRGGSLFSLNPIQAKNLPYIRPLLSTSKVELKNYLVSLKQNWREDRSNESDYYTRNLIRNQIIPLLDQCAGGKLAEKLSSMNDDAILLKQLFDDQFPKNRYEKESIDFNEVNALNPLFGHEIIHRYLIFHGQEEVSRSNIEKILSLIKSGQGNWRIQLKNGVSLVGKSKKIIIRDKFKDSDY